MFILWDVAVLYNSGFRYRSCFGASWLVLNGLEVGEASHCAGLQKISIGMTVAASDINQATSRPGKLWLKYSSKGRYSLGLLPFMIIAGRATFGHAKVPVSQYLIVAPPTVYYLCPSYQGRPLKLCGKITVIQV